jgi:hypothetical protein
VLALQFKPELLELFLVLLTRKLAQLDRYGMWCEIVDCHIGLR